MNYVYRVGGPDGNQAKTNQPAGESSYSVGQENIMWERWTEKLIRFLREEEGPTAVEYAVVLALIIVVCFTVISTIGSNSNEHFSDVALKAAFQGS